MKLSTLKKQAQRSTKYRGHKMKWGEPFGVAGSSMSQNGKCKTCDAYCFISEQHEPNLSGVSGMAVAVNCTSKPSVN